MTDANLVLGYINPSALCGGEFKLSTQGVREAIAQKVGKPLGLDVVEAAYGIFRIVNANMANAIRRVSSESGYDPREFTMVVYGGNGPVHAGMQADDLGIRRLIVPKTSPAFSALGLLIADYVVDTQRSYITPSGLAQAERINSLLAEIEHQAERELELAGLVRGALHFNRYLNMCYPGPTFDMAVPMVLSDGRMSPTDLLKTVHRFHDQHEELHTYAVREEEPIIRAVRVQTLGKTEKPRIRAYPWSTSSVESALRERRSAYFGDGFVDTPVYDGALVGFGHAFEGPAIVEEKFTTIVIYPGQSAEIDKYGNYVITLGE